MKALALLTATLLATQAIAAVPTYMDAAIANKDRPATDTARDKDRHALALLVFSTVKPGDRVADLLPGGGYFTRLFSNAVGAKGRVYAIVPAELEHLKPQLADGMRSIAAAPDFANVDAVVEPTARIGATPTAQGALDLVWTSDNYHDIYGVFGPPQAAAADAAIFRALKPGGVFVVIDHVALPGSSATAPTKLHRIDPETVKAQVLAAGFVLDASTDVLANPADSHADKVFAPGIKGHTDQFAFRFRKPKK